MTISDRAEPGADLEGLRAVVRQAVRHLRASVRARDWAAFYETLEGLEDLTEERRPWGQQEEA